MGNDHRVTTAWYGEYGLKSGASGRFRIGPTTLKIHRTDVEWSVRYEPGTDPLDDTLDVAVPFGDVGDHDPADEANTVSHFSRYSFNKTDPSLYVRPATADRAIVVRPEAPLYVPTGESVSLFISTPLWIRIDVGKPATMLVELPLIRPSDTWFGANTREGEICYNTRTKARLRLENLPMRHARAITPVRIRNMAEEALLLERFRLPVEHLSLFSDDSHFLWTEIVTFERSKGDDSASLEIGQGAPKVAGTTQRVTRPRLDAKTGLIVRPIYMLFHKMKEF